MDITITVSDADRAAGGLTRDHLDEALEIMREEGVLVLRQAVDPEHVRLLRDRMMLDLDRVLARSDLPANFIAGNVQQSPPRERGLLFRDILLNDAAIAVTAVLMGKGMRNDLYSGNTVVAGSTERQPVHADNAHLWPGMTVVAPPHVVAVNVPLVDMGAANASTELWLGTHRDTTVCRGMDIKVPVEAVERRRRLRPPVQLEVEAGSILLRDSRLWHAGMPNRSAQPRPMLAMTHTAGFYLRGRSQFPVFPKWAEPVLQHPRLTISANWVDEEVVDHTLLDHAYEYAPAARR